MNVFSLFDGMSCGQIALERAEIKVDNYFASEIDKYAIAVTQYNYSDTIQLGSITELNNNVLPEIDLLIGGSPCQGFSFAGKRKGAITKENFEILSLEQYLQLKEDNYEFEGQSYLFWEYVRILKELKPKYFLLENVRMNKKWENIITKALGNTVGYSLGKCGLFDNRIEPVMINSALVSAQNRVRLYWTNIPNITQPEDKEIYLKDIIESNVDRKKSFDVKNLDISIQKYLEKPKQQSNNIPISIAIRAHRIYKDNRQHVEIGDISKSNSLTSVEKDNYLMYSDLTYRKLTPIECERLQTIDDNHTQYGNFNDKIKKISNAQRYKMLGNGWTVDVIAHIFNSLKET